MFEGTLNQGDSYSPQNISATDRMFHGKQHYNNRLLGNREYHTTQSEEFWYALHTRRHHENVVANILLAKDIKIYLPMLEERRQWTYRTKMLRVPLFPNYVFAHFNENRKYDVLNVKGVIQIVGTHYGPSRIPDSQIHAVQIMMESKLKKDPYPFLIEGVPVRVKQGPLKGQEGILLQKGKVHRFIVCLPVLGRSIGVEINASVLEAI